MARVSDAAAREDSSKDINLTLDLALRVGELLLSSGAGAADVTATMLSVTAACGLRNCEVDVTFTALTLGYQPGPGRRPPRRRCARSGSAGPTTATSPRSTTWFAPS